MKNETGTLCKSYFHLSQFSEFAKLNSASCEFGVEITFSNEVQFIIGSLKTKTLDIPHNTVYNSFNSL